MKRVIVGIIALVVATAGSVTTGPSTAASSGAPEVSAAAAPWRVSTGVKFNSPGSTAILGHIRQTINRTPRGEKIRIMSWNFQHGAITRSLIKAHQRGVSVRVIMARQLAKKQSRSGSFKRLGRALKQGNKKRRKAMRSWTRTCSNSCRGSRGSMHSKMMLVTKAGRSTRIIQQGSANFTGSAASNQWNDWYTTAGSKKRFRGWMKVFRQASKDRSVAQYQLGTGKIWNWFAPRRSDPVMQLLNKVRCKGARGAGINNRTSIRVASAVFQNARGLRIARKLKSLHGSGCNIRVVFTMMTNKIRSAIRGVPVKQLAYDVNGDGGFDRYLHMKAMAISGRWGGNRGAHVVFNGSANWSRMGMRSDEHGMVIKGKTRLEKRYGKRISALYRAAPRTIRPSADEYRARGMKNPYAELELELPGQG